MGRLAVNGGNQLYGDISISGAKNAALPLLAAGLMSAGRTGLTLSNVPDLADTRLMIRLLDQLGMTVHQDSGTVAISGVTTNTDAPYELVSQMRASILVMGPLLARYGEARVSLPGGCAIGSRPVDLHIRAMQKLGAVVELADGYVQARTTDGLKGNKIIFPFVSVGATENAMMAACLAAGTTQLVNSAREPEIIDLAACLSAMGARISGAGTDVITIEGVSELGPACHAVVADRVEAGSYAIAVAMTGGDLCLKKMVPAHLESLFDVMHQAGVKVEAGTNEVRVSSTGHYRGIDIETQPYPGFPTDLQAQFMAMMCLAEGHSKISETIFENRFMHVPELVRMGAEIQVEGRIALVRGKPSLLPAPVRATDLRASVSLVLAALATEGQSVISDIYHLDRGYADLDAKLGACGAVLQRLD
jgi:UDP-N-acetylglucosamine 1-carboxyvinyltransferase